MNYLLPLLFHLPEGCHYPLLMLVHILWYTASWLQEQVRPCSVKSLRETPTDTINNNSGFNRVLMEWNGPIRGQAALCSWLNNTTAAPWCTWSPAGLTTSPLDLSHDPPQCVAYVTGAPCNNCLLRALCWVALLLPVAKRPGPLSGKLTQKSFLQRTSCCLLCRNNYRLGRAP